jgi:hypothetical protein
MATRSTTVHPWHLDKLLWGGPAFREMISQKTLLPHTPLLLCALWHNFGSSAGTRGKV